MRHIWNIFFSTLFYCTAVTFSMGQLGRISFFDQEINGYIYEFFMILSLILLFIKYRYKPFLHHLFSFKFTYIFFGYLFVSFLISTFSFPLFQNIVGSLYFLRLLLYITFFLYLRYQLLRQPSFNKIVERALAVIIIITITASLTQYVLYPDLRNLYYLGWDPHAYRMFGTFFEPAIAGALYGLMFVFILFQQFKLKIVGLINFFTFILLTYSRGIYIAFVITLLLFITQTLKMKMRSIFFLLLVFIVALYILPKPFGEGVNLLRTSTIQSRFMNYQEAINIWRKSSFTGVGYNHIRFVKNEATSHSGASFHSSFLIILVTGGVLGLICFYFMLKEWYAQGFFSKYAIIFLGVASLTDNILLHPFVLFLFITVASREYQAHSKK